MQIEHIIIVYTRAFARTMSHTHPTTPTPPPHTRNLRMSVLCTREIARTIAPTHTHTHTHIYTRTERESLKNKEREIDILSHTGNGHIGSGAPRSNASLFIPFHQTTTLFATPDSRPCALLREGWRGSLWCVGGVVDVLTQS